MLSGTNLRDPVLINTLGHSAGLLLFGFIILLLIRDRRTHGIRQTKLSILAAALAFGWNAGSLAALGVQNPASGAIGIVMAASFSVLSLLPAVLLQVVLKGERRWLTLTGYGISASAVILHISELFVPTETPHQWALILIAAGFGSLTLAAFIGRRRRGASKLNDAADWFSLACLLLFTTTFPHFGYQHLSSPWSAEIAWHHIGIPVALVVLLQDYRFLLLDTFVRFLVNSGLAIAYVSIVLFLSQRFQLWRMAAESLFLTGLALVALCLSLIVFAHSRNALQQWIGRAIFPRQNLDERIRRIMQLSLRAQSEDELLQVAAAEVAAHLRTPQFSIASPVAIAKEPAMKVQLDPPSGPPWAEAQIPLRFSSGDVRFLMTGARRGRQRYLSEDLQDMRRLGAVIVEQVERFRSEELKRLAAQAELRALQAQINPHFLFNALNTLYGSIDRRAHNARRMVLNLAEIFRYFLQGDRLFIPLSEELRIVEAYLEIEALRLADRLETKLRVSDDARTAMIPVLSVQPLVENAVKHGVAAKQGRGRVTVRAEIVDGMLRIAVEDTGLGFGSGEARPYAGTGVGLENVRRRLQLSYGPAAALEIRSSVDGSTVTFQIPAGQEHCAAAEVAV